MQIYSLQPLVRDSDLQIKQHAKADFNTRQFTWSGRDTVIEWKIVNGKWQMFQHFTKPTLQDAIEVVKKTVGLCEECEELLVGVRNLIVHLNPTSKQKNLSNVETLKNLIAEMYPTEAEDRFRVKAN